MRAGSRGLSGSDRWVRVVVVVVLVVASGSLSTAASAAPGDLHITLEMADGSPGEQGVILVYDAATDTVVASGNTGTTGEATIVGIEEGDYVVEIQGGLGFPRQWVPGVLEENDAQTVTVVAGVTTDLNVTVIAYPTIKGTLREAGTNRAPTGDWNTVVLDGVGGSHDTTRDGDAFVIYINQPSEVRFAFEFATPFDDEFYQTWYGGTSSATARRLDVDYNDIVDVGEIVVGLPGRLVVEATFESLLRPVEEPAFLIVDSDGEEVRPLNFLSPIVTEVLGGFDTSTEILLLPGTYYVLAYWPGTNDEFIQAVFPTWVGDAPLYRSDRAAASVLSSSGTTTVEVNPAPFYPDMFQSVFLMDIVWMHYTGITTGCGEAGYCPDDPVTRGQMAAFLVRALRLTDSDPDIEFSDDDDSPFERDIERLATAGITTGCGGDRFCPDDPVTRGQMAAFLVRAMGYTDQGNTDFVDDDGSVFESDIEKLAAAGVTTGCGEGTFCPNDNVTRGQMAAFLHRALGGGVLYPGEAGSGPLATFADPPSTADQARIGS